MRVALIGDVAFFGKNTINNPDIQKYLQEVKDYLEGFDLVVANLEAPFTNVETKVRGKSAYLKSDPRNIELLSYLGIDVVNIANNHMCDYGIKGYRDTVELLDNAGIMHFGASNDSLRLEINGERICFYGVCGFSSNPKGVAGQKDGVLNPYNLENVVNFLSDSHAKGWFNILSVHSGLEHVNFPSLDDVDAARYMASLGDYVYYGHHPHVIQGVEKVSGSLIAYSLGNFIFDDVYTEKSKKPLVVQDENNKLGLVLGLQIKNKKIANYENQLIYQKEGKLDVLKKEDFPREYQLLELYSNALSSDRVAYDRKRIRLLAKHLAKRKKMRDVSWYIKRLNIESLYMILSAKENARLEFANFKSFLIDLVREKTI